VRVGLAQAFAGAALDPGSAQSVPFDYQLLLTARSVGIPPWVLEGYPIDQPPVEWIARLLEFSHLERGVNVTRR
jgi:hypothetical protein